MGQVRLVQVFCALLLLLDPVFCSFNSAAGTHLTQGKWIPPYADSVDSSQASSETSSLSQRLSLRDSIKLQQVAFVETEVEVLDKDTEQVYLALERRFKDVSSHLSMGTCVKRAKMDIAESAVVAMEAQLKTTFIFKIIFAIATPLVMMFVTPLLVKLIMLIGKPIGDFLTPRIVKSCAQFLDSVLIPLMEDTLGMYLQSKLSISLANKLGILLMDAFVFHIPRVLGRELPPQMTNYVLRIESPVVAKEIAHRVLHTMTHSLTHSISRSLPRLVADSVEKGLGHNLVNYYYCIYCYEKGEFCNYCHAYLGLQAKSQSAEDFGPF